VYFALQSFLRLLSRASEVRMMKAFDLKHMERRSWRLLQKDGLTDALFGTIFLSAAVVGVLDHVQVADGLRIAALAAIQFGGVIGMILLRKRYVTPRLGRVKFAPQRVRRTNALRVFLGICVGMTVLLVVLTTLSGRLGFTLFGDLSSLGVWLVISAVILVPIGALAYVLEYPRLLLYGTFLSVAEFLHVVVDLPERLPFAATYIHSLISLIAFTVGISISLRFIRLTPKPEFGEKGGSS